MKELFSKTSTTSVVAVLTIILGFGLLFFVTGGGVPKDEATRTQIVQGVFGLLMLACGYYFGASKQRGMVQQSADTITNTTTPAKTEEDQSQ